VWGLKMPFHFNTTVGSTEGKVVWRLKMPFYFNTTIVCTERHKLDTGHEKHDILLELYYELDLD
jgi:hypothetical protein